MSEQPRRSVILEDEPLLTNGRNGGPNGQAPRRRRGWLWVLLLILAAAAAYRFWPRGGAPQPATSAAPPASSGRHGFGGITPVVAVKATKGDIGVYITDPGAVVPVYTVTVASQISGYLMKVLYKEGDMVHQGDPLAEIDPRPYQVQLETAQAALARDQANLNNARVDLQRYQTLVPLRAVPEQTLATQQALVKSDEGTVQTDQAQIDSAKLNLAYCHITAPITGRVGLRLVDPGNYVQPSNGLVVITQLQPITVIFPIPEDNIPQALAGMKKGARLPVEAYDRDMKQKLATGYLMTIDNQIDPTTGTVKFKALFPNKGNELFPNQFVNARLLLETKHDTTIIPQAAVQRGPKGAFVYTIKPDMSATVRPVTVGPAEGDDISIEAGLSPGEPVVVEGADRLREGSKVELQGQSGKGRRSRK